MIETVEMTLSNGEVLQAKLMFKKYKSTYGTMYRPTPKALKVWDELAENIKVDYAWRILPKGGK